MKPYLYVAGQILLWGLFGTVFLVFVTDWHKTTWFDLLFVAAYLGVVGYYSYRLLESLTYGTEAERRLITLNLPESGTIALSIKGCQNARAVLFSHHANLTALSGNISLRDGNGRIVERLLLNQSQDAADLEPAEKSVRINGGGKSASIDYLRALTLQDIGKEDDKAHLDFSLDWSPRTKKFAINKLKSSIVLEVIWRVRKLLPEHQPSPLTQS